MDIRDIFTNFDEVYDGERTIYFNSIPTDFLPSILLHSDNIDMIAQISDHNTDVCEKDLIDMISMNRIKKCSMDEYRQFKDIFTEMTYRYVDMIFDVNTPTHGVEELNKFIIFVINQLRELDIILENMIVKNNNVSVLTLDEFLTILIQCYEYHVSEHLIDLLVSMIDTSCNSIFKGSNRTTIYPFGKDFCYKIPRSSIHGIKDSASELKLYHMLRETFVSNNLVPIYQSDVSSSTPIILALYVNRIYDFRSPEAIKMVTEFNDYIKHNYNLIVDGPLTHHGNLGELNSKPIIIDYGNIWKI